MNAAELTRRTLRTEHSTVYFEALAYDVDELLLFFQGHVVSLVIKTYLLPRLFVEVRQSVIRVVFNVLIN